MTIRDMIEDNNPDAIFMSESLFDEAIIGVIRTGDTYTVVYDYGRCIDLMITFDGITEQEAVDHLDYNCQDIVFLIRTKEEYEAMS